MSEWSNEKVLQFLELYGAERLIWDPRDIYHKHKPKINDAWKRISYNLGYIPVDELKAKKNSLMATFRSLCRKKKESMKSAESADDILQPVWFAYDTMERILGHLYDGEETSESNPFEIERKDKIKNTKARIAPYVAPCVAKKNICHGTTSQGIEMKLAKNITESFANLNQLLDKRKEEDECDLYGKLLAKKLRKYPEAMRYGLMYNIDGLLLDNPYPNENERPTSSCS